MPLFMVKKESLAGYELDGRALSFGEAEQDKVIRQSFNVDRIFPKRNHSQECKRLNEIFCGT